MNVRTFGRTGYAVSALGLGCMRFPTTTTGEIDEAHAIRMVRWAIDHGVNYLDTAYGYHGGKSEVLVGKALLDGYRAKTAIATKMPCWHVNSHDDLDRLFNEQLVRLQTNKVDFYLLHGLGAGNWPKMRDLGAVGWLKQQVAAGRIGHFGFSFHDKVSVFREIVDAADWSFCQIQYNYLNEDYQAGTEGLQYAAAKGLAVVAMEPLLGGKLARLPEAIAAQLAAKSPGTSAVELALNWLWDKPEISLVLSGMSTLEQVQQNVALAGRSAVGMLGEAGRSVVAEAQTGFKDLTPIACTNCGYCLPCPQGVAIPRTFAMYNDSHVFGTTAGQRRNYGKMKAEERAASCVACGECEDKCPQHLPISTWMPKVDAFLAATT